MTELGQLLTANAPPPPPPPQPEPEMAAAECVLAERAAADRVAEQRAAAKERAAAERAAAERAAAERAATTEHDEAMCQTPAVLDSSSKQPPLLPSQVAVGETVVLLTSLPHPY